MNTIKIDLGAWALGGSMTICAALAFVFIFSTPARAALPAGSVVQVIAYKDGDILNQGTGVVVADGGVVATSAHLSFKSDRLVILGVGGAELPATPLREEADQDLLLVQATALTAPPATLAVGVEASDTLTVQGFWAADDEQKRPAGVFRGRGKPRFVAAVQSEKTATGIVQSATASAVTVLANFGRGGYGAPLADDCNAVVGLVRKATAKDVDEAWRLHAHGPRVEAVPAAVIADMVASAGLTATVADVACGAQIAAAEDAEDQAKEAAEKRAREAEKKAQEEAEKRKEAEESAEAAEEKAEETNDVAEALADQAEKLRIEAEAKEQEKARQRMIIGGVSVLALLAAGLLIWVFVLRKKDRAEAEDALNKATARYADTLFEGVDSSGAPVALKVSGGDLMHGADGVIIGREPDQSQFVIGDDTVSRRHARLCLEDDALTIEDLDSANGTRVNGAKLSPHVSTALGHSDVVEFGGVRVTFRVLED